MYDSHEFIHKASPRWVGLELWYITLAESQKPASRLYLPSTSGINKDKFSETNIDLFDTHFDVEL
ncbi:unnamed protein product, partial [Nesidiocoris tenuis]